MLRVHPRVTGLALAGILTVALSGCGSAAEPDLTTLPNSDGSVLAAPDVPSTTSAPPTSSAPPSASARPSAGPATPVSRPAVRAAATAGSSVAWKPAGGDEFNGSGLNTGQWATYDSVGGLGHGLRKPEAVTQNDGLLTITARPREGEGVSGGVAHLGGQLYGRWEFRARTDKGRGFGSAILLWPDSEQWPADGELDMMEVPSENRDLAHAIIHYSKTGSDDNTYGDSHPGDYSQWHTFALEWLPDRITWYVDGVKRFETTDKVMIPTKPMHMTIQLDQGPRTAWLDAPDDTTPDEVKLQVDWVRISAAP